MKQLFAGHKADATDLFGQCLATGQKNYVEYEFAGAELQDLKF